MRNPLRNSLIPIVFICSCIIAPAKAQQVSIWSPSAVPQTVTDSDSTPIEVGTRFQSSVAGKVTSIRFYKGPYNTGTHIGHLWSNTGTLLATVTFTNETATGWQQANFSSPVAIQPNTPYVVSYQCPQGHYSDDQYYFNSAVTNGPLTALKDGTNGPNGVYVYGSGGFPNQTWNASNYWVDLTFVPTSSSGTSVQVSMWNPSTVPTTVTDPDSTPIELGMRFQSSVAGSVTSVRFYKGPNNTGTHIGHLWSNTGTLLATLTFTNETATGWQQANFPSPVAIQPNTPYVVSYQCPQGHYSDDEYYFNSAVTNGPLTALQNGANGPNGIYAYGTGGFPTQTWNASNYWVDLVFIPSSSSGTYTISGTVSGAPATLTLSGSSSASTTTNATGSYSFVGLTNGTYMVAASQPGYTFTPPTASASVSGSSVGGVNFTSAASTVTAQHTVSLTWAKSTSANVVGYKVYRSNISGGPYTLLTSSPIGTTDYTDGQVSSGQVYYYVATAVDGSNNESLHSNQAAATVPTP